MCSYLFLFHNKLDKTNGITEENEYEKIDKTIVGNPWIFMSWTWHSWNCAADLTDGSILHGNGILFCKKLRETSCMVYRNKPI